MATTEPLTADVKYVFVDVVGFTRNRSIEAQADIVAAINRIVRQAVEQLSVEPKSVLYLPTGDGMCIAFVDVPRPFDVHILLALAIVAGVAEWNSASGDRRRQFEVRVGVAQNVDNLITDINERLNVAGVGISTAQRVMSVADGGQVLVSSAVYDVLQGREKYDGCLVRHEALVKHGARLPVFQLVCPHPGLSVTPPSAVVARDGQISRTVAYYIAIAIAHRDWLLNVRDLRTEYAAVVYYLQALDEAGAERDEFAEYAWWHGNSTASQYECFYDNNEYGIARAIWLLLRDGPLASIAECFEGPADHAWVWVNENGVRRLRESHPDIYERFVSVTGIRERRIAALTESTTSG